MYENRSGDGNFIMAREATHNLNGCGRYRRKLFTKLLQRLGLDPVDHLRQDVVK